MHQNEYNWQRVPGSGAPALNPNDQISILGRHGKKDLQLYNCFNFDHPDWVPEDSLADRVPLGWPEFEQKYSDRLQVNKAREQTALFRESSRKRQVHVQYASTDDPGPTITAGSDWLKKALESNLSAWGSTGYNPETYRMTNK